MKKRGQYEIYIDLIIPTHDQTILGNINFSDNWFQTLISNEDGWQSSQFRLWPLHEG